MGRLDIPAPVASAYLLLARTFSYPTRELHEFLAGPELPRDLAAISAVLPFSAALDSIGSPEASLEELESHYVEFFDVGFGPSLACPLYEGAYRREELPRRQIFDELLRFYDHFGARLSERYRDYPDHLCAELEFVAFLNLKGSQAAGRPEPTSYDLAQRDFLERHLARWIGPLRDRIFEHVRLSLYRASVVSLVSLVDGHRKELLRVLAEERPPVAAESRQTQTRSEP